MTVRGYPEYLESGNDWLGYIPSEWKVVRFKHLFRERDERSTTGDETLLSVSAYTGVKPRSEITEPGEYLSRAETLIDYKLTFQNDLVINIMLAWNKALGVADQGGIVSPAYCVFKPNGLVNPSFIHYALRSNEYVSYFKAHSTGVVDSRLRLYPDVFLSLNFTLPPQTEQSAIVAFLDRETGKIDALVAEQERLIALLKEKRQAVISHAVTKGLNRDASMKDSGVPWLGEVPAHWTVLPLSRITRSMCDGPFGSGLKSEHYMSDGARVIRLQNIRKAGFNGGDAAFIDEIYFKAKLSGHDVRANDVLIAGLGDERNTVGRACVAPDNLGPALVKADCFRFRMQEDRVLPEFLALQLTSGAEFDAGHLSSGSTRSRIPLSVMATRLIVLPSLSEQKAIHLNLQTKMAALAALDEQATRAITLLRERRAALISAAVTGKIDVRDSVLAPQNAA